MNIYHLFDLMLLVRCNSSTKTNMVSTSQKRQSKRRLPSQLYDFDQNIINGNTASDRQENATVKEVLVARNLPLVILAVV